MAEIGKDIAKAKLILDEGGLVAIPTETVYGLAGNALNPDSVAGIFETKKRPSFDPLIIHTSSIEKVEGYISGFPAVLRKLAEKFWPGPLTVLLPRNEIIPDLVTSGLDRVAVRIPSHPLTLELLKILDYPLAAPSANPFGYISPTMPEHVNAQLGDKISYILDGGSCEVGLESTIVGLEGGEVIIYRLGGLELAGIEEVAGPVIVKTHSSSNPQAPGLLESHYAPRKPLVLGDLETLIPEYLRKGISFAVLSFEKHFDEIDTSLQIQLSSKGSLREAAQNLFASMRKLDETHTEAILAELMPDQGLGRAMNDRLRRAAAQA